MRHFILCVVCFLVSFSLFAASPSAQQLVPAGHWVYQALGALAYETGETTFATSAPLSIAELRLYLKQIEYETLSKAGKAAFDRVEAYFDAQFPSFGPKLFSIGTDPSVGVELRYKSHDNIQWITPYQLRKKLIELPLILSIGDYAIIRSDLTFGQGYWASQSSSIVNIPFTGDDIDFHFPQTSYISAGAFSKEGEPFMNFQLGSTPLQVGSTQTGSIILSDSLLRPSYAQLSFFSPRVRYAVTPIQLEVNKYLYLHRLEARPFKRFSVGLVEGVLISQPFELRFLNPASIFHNMNTWFDYDGYPDSDSSAYFGATFDLNPWKYIRIYGLYIMNQFQSAFETNGNEEAKKTPNGLGGQGGIEAWIPHGMGYWHAGIEAVYTVPWLYLMPGNPGDERTGPRSFFKSSLFMPKSGTPEYSWVGYPFGPDCIVGLIQLGYTVFDRWSVSASYRLRVQGENSFESAQPASVAEARMVTPTGIPEYEHAVTLKGSYRFFDWFTLNAQAAYVHCLNFGHMSGKKADGVELSLSAHVYISPLIFSGAKK